MIKFKLPNNSLQRPLWFDSCLPLLPCCSTLLSGHNELLTIHRTSPAFACCFPPAKCFSSFPYPTLFPWPLVSSLNISLAKTSLRTKAWLGEPLKQSNALLLSYIGTGELLMYHITLWALYPAALTTARDLLVSLLLDCIPLKDRHYALFALEISWCEIQPGHILVIIIC